MGVRRIPGDLDATARRSSIEMLATLTRTVALLLAGSCVLPVAAWAAVGDEDALIRHGLELRRAGDDEAARAELQQAYDQEPSPRAAAQLGFVEQALGQWAKADEHVGEALKTPADPWIRRNRAIIEDAHDRIQAHLTRHPPPAAVAPPAFSSGPTAGSSLMLATAVPRPSEAGHTKVMLGVALGGVGIAALVGGVALSLASDSPATTATTVSAATPPSMAAMPPGMAAMPPAVAMDPKKKKAPELALDAAPSATPSSHAWAADALYITGAAALLTGGILVVLGKQSQRESRSVQTVSLRPLLAPGSVGAAVNLRF
jgi:tetratricopeptide (TPR) repeat protein